MLNDDLVLSLSTICSGKMILMTIPPFLMELASSNSMDHVMALFSASLAYETYTQSTESCAITATCLHGFMKTISMTFQQSPVLK